MIGLALRNLARHKARTTVTLVAIAFGIGGLIVSGGFVRDMFVQLGEASIHSQTGHLQFAARGYFSLGGASPDKFRIDEPKSYERAITSVAGVKQVMERIRFSGLLNNGRSDQPIIGEGVEPDKESALGTYLKLVAGRMLTDRDDVGIMIGDGLARTLKLNPGDRVTLLVNTVDGALNTVDLDLIGVFQTYSREFDARAVKIPIKAAQEALATNGANVLVIELQNTENTHELAAELQRRFGAQGMEIKTWQQLNDFYEKTVALYRRQFGILQVIVLAMVVLGVANSVSMGAFERIGEFGTMRALGNSGKDVFYLIVTESALLGFIGGIIGVLLGIAAALVISKVGIPMPPPPNASLGYRAMVRIVPDVIGSAFLAGLGAALLAGILPAIKVSRMSVVNALRANV